MALTCRLGPWSVLVTIRSLQRTLIVSYHRTNGSIFPHVHCLAKVRFGGRLSLDPAGRENALTSERRLRILVGLCGAAALVDMAQYLHVIRRSYDAEVRVVMTPAAERIMPSGVWNALSTGGVWTDSSWFSAEHEALASWADLVLVMPCTATTLSAIASGSASSLLTATVLCADEVVVVPSMNERMYLKAAVQRNISVLVDDHMRVVEMLPREVYVFGTKSYESGLGMAGTVEVLKAIDSAIRSINRRRSGAGS